MDILMSEQTLKFNRKETVATLVEYGVVALFLALSF
jgi:Flp pilus assembly pilin Flp